MPRRNSSLLLWTKIFIVSGVNPVGSAAMVVYPEDPEIEKNQSSSIFQYRSPGRLIYWFIGFLYWFFSIWY